MTSHSWVVHPAHGTDDEPTKGSTRRKKSDPPGVMTSAVSATLRIEVNFQWFCLLNINKTDVVLSSEFIHHFVSFDLQLLRVKF